jgi:hypothetical protein
VDKPDDGTTEASNSSTSDQIAKLRQALKDLSYLQQQQQTSPDSSKQEPKQSQSFSSLEEVQQRAKVEALKSADTIYEEVVMDEINDELLKSAQKCDGDIVVMLLRQERLSSFSKLWKQANLDFYQTQKNRRPITTNTAGLSKVDGVGENKGKKEQVSQNQEIV